MLYHVYCGYYVEERLLPHTEFVPFCTHPMRDPGIAPLEDCEECEYKHDKPFPIVVSGGMRTFKEAIADRRAKTYRTRERLELPELARNWRELFND